MQETVLLSLPVSQLQVIIIDAVNACLDVRQGIHTDQPVQDQFLTIQEAAELLHLTVPTIYGLVSRSEIPVSKKGKRLYFSKQELMDWVKTGRKQTIAETAIQADKYLSGKKKRG